MLFKKRAWCFVGIYAMFGAQAALAKDIVVSAANPKNKLVVVTEKAGLLGFMGSRHAIEAGSFKTVISLKVGGKAHVTIDVGSLLIDPQPALRFAGLTVGPSDEDKPEIKRKMLSLLDYNHHKEITLNSKNIKKSDFGYLVTANLTIRGITREKKFEVFEEHGRLFGQFYLTHTEFGMTPVSVAGVINVADEMKIKFQIFLPN